MRHWSAAPIARVGILILAVPFLGCAGFRAALYADAVPAFNWYLNIVNGPLIIVHNGPIASYWCLSPSHPHPCTISGEQQREFTITYLGLTQLTDCAV
jgi:hypothetical protein